MTDYESSRVLDEYVCADCGRESAAPCPLGAPTCSECSALRDGTRADCIAHGAWLAPAD